MVDETPHIAGNPESEAGREVLPASGGLVSGALGAGAVMGPARVPLSLALSAGDLIADGPVRETPPPHPVSGKPLGYVL